MKKKLLRIFLFIMTLLSCIVPSELNGTKVRKVEAETINNGTYVYFELPAGWDASKVSFMVGNSGYSQGFNMTKLGSTGIYYVKMPQFDNYYDYSFFNVKDWGGENNSIDNRKNYSPKETNTMHTKNGGGTFTILSGYNIFGGSGTTPSGTYGENYASLNLNIKVTTETGGSVTASGTKLSSATAVATNSGTSISVLKYTNATLTATANEGYSFKGWYDGSTQVSTSATTTITDVTASKTYTAKWTAKTYTITLNNQGTTTTTTATYNSAMKDIPVPQRTGYTFGGYFDDVNGGGSQYYKADGTSHQNWNKTSNTTLYAKWTANTWDITYNTNGGAFVDINAVPRKHTYDTETTLPTSLTKTGYIFDGWYDNEECTGNAISSIPAQTDNNTEFWAKWTAETYTVSFVLDGGTIDGNSSYEDIVVTYDSTYGHTVNGVFFPTSTPIHPNENYEFAGWFIEGKGDSITSSSKVQITNDTKLVAVWVEKVPVIFNANTGRWSNGAEEFTKYYYKNKTYDFNNSTFPDPNDLSKTGYSFDGWHWYTDQQEEIKVDVSDTLKSNEQHTLYAHWIANPYYVTFDVNGGETQHKDIVVTYDQPYGELPTPEKKGYKFDGWYTNKIKENGSLITKDTIVQITAVQTLYAQWSPISYSVEFNNNAENVEGNINTINKIVYDSDPISLPDGSSLSRTGYKFAGWYTDPNCTDDAKLENIYNLSAKDDDIKTLYAKWSPITYNLKLYDNFNKALNDDNDQHQPIYDVSYGATEDAKEFTIKHAGYELEGWSETRNGDIKYLPNEILNATTKDGETVHLYARWKYVDYSITYDLGEGGSINGNNPDSYNIYTTSLIINEPTRSPYTFVGWTIEELGITTPTFDPGSKILENQENYQNLTLKANWEAKVTLYVDAQVLRNALGYDMPWDELSLYYWGTGNNSTIDWNDREYMTKLTDTSSSIRKYSFYFDETTHIKGFILRYIQSSAPQGQEWQIGEKQSVDIEVSWTYLNNGEEYFINIPNTLEYKDGTNVCKSINSISVAPHTEYYFKSTDKVYSSSYENKKDFKFIEKEGYYLEGWYTDPNKLGKDDYRYDQEKLKAHDFAATKVVKLYGNYIPLNDYCIYVDTKDVPWKENSISIYLFNDYFSTSEDNKHENAAWSIEDKSNVTYIGNNIYKIKLDVSKSYSHIIIRGVLKEGVTNGLVQTIDIKLDSKDTYFSITQVKQLNSGGTSCYSINDEKYNDSLLVAQKNTSNTEINSYRFTAGLEEDAEGLYEETNKEFGYKFIFVKDNDSFIGYWNFEKDNMFDNFSGDTNPDSTYKGYYSLTLNDSASFKYSDYDTIIVVGCYRATTIDSETGQEVLTTYISRAAEYTIIKLDGQIYLYQIER